MPLVTLEAQAQGRRPGDPGGTQRLGREVVVFRHLPAKVAPLQGQVEAAVEHQAQPLALGGFETIDPHQEGLSDQALPLQAADVEPALLGGQGLIRGLAAQQVEKAQRIQLQTLGRHVTEKGCPPGRRVRGDRAEKVPRLRHLRHLQQHREQFPLLARVPRQHQSPMRQDPVQATAGRPPARQLHLQAQIRRGQLRDQADQGIRPLHILGLTGVRPLHVPGLAGIRPLHILGLTGVRPVHALALTGVRPMPGQGQQRPGIATVGAKGPRQQDLRGRGIIRQQRLTLRPQGLRAPRLPGQGGIHRARLAAA